MSHVLTPTPACTPPTGASRAPVVASLRGVSVRIGLTPILRDVSLELAPGEVVALTGPNGSGKSTLLRVLATLLPPASGSVELFGRALRRGRLATTRRSVALIAHEAALHPQLSLARNLALVADLVGRERGSVARVLAEVGLHAAADRPVRACSEGMKRRTELARVLLTRPRLLLLDEAHAALDMTARSLVARVARDVAERGGAAVLVTHDPAGLADLADRRVELHDGRLVERSLT